MEKVSGELKDKILETDKKIFSFLYGIAQENILLRRFALIFGKGAHYIFFVIYGLIGLFLVVRTDMRVVPYAVIPMAVLMLNTALRKVFKCERPFVNDDNIENMIGHKESYSFPSNHAASAMVIAMAVSFIEIKALAVMIPLAVMTGVSRVMSGVHYPKDVAAGWLIGATLGTVGFTAAKLYLYSSSLYT